MPKFLDEHDNPEFLSMADLLKIEKEDPDDPRLKKELESSKAAFAKLRLGIEKRELDFIAALREVLPWFDNTLQDWSRLRGLLTLKFGKGLDWWYDSCNQQMLIGFVRALADDSPDEIARADLLKMLGIKSSALNYRIDKMGFPVPTRKSGRKQWFNCKDVDAWCASQPKK